MVDHRFEGGLFLFAGLQQNNPAVSQFMRALKAFYTILPRSPSSGAYSNYF